VKLHLFTASEDLDPFSLEAMKAANPAFGDFLNADEVKDQAQGAKRMPAREAAYRNLVLNQRVNTVNPLISRSVWIANGSAPDPSSFDGEVFLGLDLSARNDLTAAVAVAKSADGIWDVESQFFAPLQGVAERSARDRQPYDVWARDGYLTLTPGSSIDYSWVAQWLVDYCSQRNVRTIRFDRWRIDVLKAELTRIGVELPLEPFGQGFKDMTPAVDTLENLLVNCKIRHGMNPILTMCAANAVAIRDPAGNRKLDKSKSTGRIDGMVAMAMALGTAATSGDATSVYETRGILIV
jgi:phage terminase large subunit-like protein